MKILMVSSYLPYPLSSGGHIRLYNIIKNLSRNHQITLLCEKRSYQNEKDIGEVGKFCKEIVVVNRKKQWTLKNIFKTSFSKYSFLVTGHTHSQMKREIKKILEKENFDLIHVETFYIMQNLPKVSIPVVLTEHNIEYMVYKRYKDRAPLILRPLLNIDILKLKYQEERFWKRADHLIAVSDNEAKFMRLKNKRVTVVPNGVDTQKFQISNLKFQIKDNGEKVVLFIGDFKWIENRDAAQFILKDIWPKIKLKIENGELKIKLWIVGKKIPDSLKKLGGENVFFDEDAPSDTSKIYEKADVLLAPIRIGGGTSFKILEAMASGVVVVTTRLGIEGVSAIDSRDVLIADDKEELAKWVLKLLQDEDFYREIAKNARKIIEDKYDWKIIIKRLEDAYQSVLQA